MMSPLRLRPAPAVTALLALMIAAAATPIVANAQSAESGPTIQQLQKEVEARDAIIRDLLRRVEKLESELDPRDAAAGGKAATRRKNVAAAKAMQDDPPAPPIPTPPPAAATTAPAAPSRQQTQLAQQGANPPPAAQGAAQAPGQFAVSEEAAERALERALVQTGALLLPPGVAEAVPGITYIRREATQANQLVLTSNGQLLLQNLLRNDEVDGSLLLRAGLPWYSQIEVTLPPVVYKNNSTATQVVGSALSEQTVTARGFGDPTFTFIKGLTHEGEWMPSLFGSVAWSADLGQTQNGIPLGNGFNELSASLTAAKRQDPLVFIGGLGYTTSFQKNGVQPGDQYTTTAGVLFAVSPETSLQFAPKLTFVNEEKFQGARVPGSNQLVGVFSVGLLSILAPGFVLNLTTDIGFTHDAPAFDLKLQFPIRFDLGA